MHNLDIIKRVSFAAIGQDEDDIDPADYSLFQSVCDPGTVYTLCTRIEKLESEISRLNSLIAK
jgi:hypothetical protein